jgi:HAD superfamily hydrolase (TIGR01509 family)
MVLPQKLLYKNIFFYGIFTDMENIPAVIFDMDGVLLDTETICDRVWEQTAQEMHLSDIDKAINECRGCNKADTRLLLQKRYGCGFDVEYMMARTSELFHVIEDREGIPIMKGVETALAYLKKNGYRLALASSTRGLVVRRQLTDAGLISFFETITTGEQVIHSKPDPEIYRKACGSLGLAPSICVAIEDSPNGIRSAYAAGMKCVMIPDKIQPTDEIRSLLWKCCTSLDCISTFL